MVGFQWLFKRFIGAKCVVIPDIEDIQKININSIKYWMICVDLNFIMKTYKVS